jgi:hypothetical protein
LRFHVVVIDWEKVTVFFEAFDENLNSQKKFQGILLSALQQPDRTAFVREWKRMKVARKERFPGKTFLKVRYRFSTKYIEWSENKVRRFGVDVAEIRALSSMEEEDKQGARWIRHELRELLRLSVPNPPPTESDDS